MRGVVTAIDLFASLVFSLGFTKVAASSVCVSVQERRHVEQRSRPPDVAAVGPLQHPGAEDDVGAEVHSREVHRAIADRRQERFARDEVGDERVVEVAQRGAGGGR